MSQPNPSSLPSSVLFDRFELQPLQRRLLRDGEPLVLRARAFDLLQALALRDGGLVTKAELLDTVWPGLVVEENNIAAQIVALRKVIGGDLIATVPGRGYRLAAQVRYGADAAAPPAAAPTPSAAAAAPAPLAPPALAALPLIGREDDLARLDAALLAGGGCVTLVGAGGVGKTALARAMAARWPTLHASGTASSRPVAWTDLAAASDASQLTGVLCRALGIVESPSATETRAAIASALAQGDWLVVLDNAEHLVDAVAALAAELLGAAPALALLVTSQLPLRIAGERVQALDPLELPADDAPDAQASAAASVRLLIERVRAADPRFVFGDDALALLRRICTRLDGLPLALEMAAAIVPLLGLHGVLAALDERFSALRRGQRGAPERHKTLRAALAWSHDLLQPDEQRVFRRLGVFASSFSLDLAVSVTGDDAEDRWAVIDALSALVERSLVTSLHTDPPRYRLLETMRSFALEQLAASGETAALHTRAAAALNTVMSQGVDGALDPRAAAELANVPELLGWSRRHAPLAAIELTVSAARVATWTPWLSEAVHWVEDAEPLLRDASIPPAAQAAWWRELARFQSFVRGPRTVEAARHASAIERSLGNASGLFMSLVPLLRSRALEPDEFEAIREEAQTLLNAHPEWPARHRVIFSGSLAMEYRRRGDFEAALQHQQDEADEAERAGLFQAADNAQSNLAATLIGLGRFGDALQRLRALLQRNGAAENPVNAHHRVQLLNALIGLGRLDEAQAAAADALAWGRRYGVLDVLQVLALLAAHQGRAAVAAMLLGHYEAALHERGAELPADSHAPWRGARWRAAEALGEPALQDLQAQGARLDAAAADRLMFEPST